MRPKNIFELIREVEEAVKTLRPSLKDGHEGVGEATKNIRRILSTIIRRTRKWQNNRRNAGKCQK